MSYRDLGLLKMFLFGIAVFFVGGTTAHAGAPNISYAQYGSLAEVKMGDSVTLLCQSFCDYGPAIYFDGLSEKLTIPDSWTATQVVFRVPATVSVGAHTLKVKLRDTGEVSTNDLAIKVMAAPDTPIISSISPSEVYNSGYSGPNPGTGTNYDEVKITGSYGPNGYLMFDGVGFYAPGGTNNFAWISGTADRKTFTFGIRPSVTPGIHKIQIGNSTGGSNPVLLTPSNEVLLTVLDGSTRAPVWSSPSSVQYEPFYEKQASPAFVGARYVDKNDIKFILDGESIPFKYTPSPYPSIINSGKIDFILPATITAGTHYVQIDSVSGKKAKSEKLSFLVQSRPSWQDPVTPPATVPEPEITLTPDVTSTTLSKIITIKVATKNTIGNSSWEYFAPGTSYGVVNCSSAGAASGLEIRCIAYEPGGTSVYAELHNGGKVYKSNVVQISFSGGSVVPQVIPELNLTGSVNGTQSPYTINMKVGETLTVIGAPKNIKQGFTFKITPKFQGLCSTDLSDNRAWLFTCKPTTQMSEFFSVEIIQDGKTYVSNLLKVNVISDIANPITKASISQTVPTAGIESSTKNSIAERIAYLKNEIAKQNAVTNTAAAPKTESDIPFRVGCVDIGRTIKVRSVDTASRRDVTDLQSYLAEQGYLKAKPTGYFGSLTMKAVTAFQKAHGIQTTGTAGPLTRAKIKNLTCN